MVPRALQPAAPHTAEPRTHLVGGHTPRVDARRAAGAAAGAAAAAHALPPGRGQDIGGGAAHARGVRRGQHAIGGRAAGRHAHASAHAARALAATDLGRWEEGGGGGVRWGLLPSTRPSTDASSRMCRPGTPPAAQGPPPHLGVPRLQADEARILLHLARLLRGRGGGGKWQGRRGARSASTARRRGPPGAGSQKGRDRPARAAPTSIPSPPALATCEHQPIHTLRTRPAHLDEDKAAHDVAHSARPPLERPVHHVRRVAHAHVVAGCEGLGMNRGRGGGVGPKVGRSGGQGRGATGAAGAARRRLAAAPGSRQQRAPRSAAAAAALTAILDAGPPVVHLALDVGQAAQPHVGLVGAALRVISQGEQSRRCE